MMVNAPAWCDWHTFGNTLVSAGILLICLVLLLYRKIWDTL
ncbi:MAG TPA: hypothetical protein VJ943_01355 [Desulfotignum sp.]|nr:hypothetical protein [Desulfotignum sp.]